MKKIGCFLLVMSVLFCLQIIPAFAVPLDLNGFNDADVVVNGTGSDVEVLFQEDWYSDQWWFYNGAYEVADNATVLTFDYELNLTEYDVGDYFVFDVNFSNELLIDANSSNTFSFDLSSYRGQTIDIAWGLLYGYSADDLAAGTSARIFNIDVGTSTTKPIPEPATILLIGTGMIGLTYLRKKKS